MVMGIRNRVSELERRVDAIETEFQQQFRAQLDALGKYKSRSEEELLTIRGQLEVIVSTLENLVDIAEDRAAAEDARSLLRRARNNLTRAINAAS